MPDDCSHCLEERPRKRDFGCCSCCGGLCGRRCVGSGASAQAAQQCSCNRQVTLGQCDGCALVAATAARRSCLVRFPKKPLGIFKHDTQIMPQVLDGRLRDVAMNAGGATAAAAAAACIACCLSRSDGCDAATSAVMAGRPRAVMNARFAWSCGSLAKGMQVMRLAILLLLLLMMMTMLVVVLLVMDGGVQLLKRFEMLWCLLLLLLMMLLLLQRLLCLLLAKLCLEERELQLVAAAHAA